MNILLHGCNGRMGQVVSRLSAAADDINILCGVDSCGSSKTNHNEFPVYLSLDAIPEANAQKIDIIIDFSNHTTVEALIAFASMHDIGLVLCTTGYTPEEKVRIQDASKQLPIFNSGNMSLGINLLAELVKQAAAKLMADFDIEIIEKHHNQKLDAPSGTALMLANAANSANDNKLEYIYQRESKTEKRATNELGIHSIRGGAIVGEHSVIFAGLGEVIELKHSALSRDVFGVGAIKAARYMLNKPAGLYDMKDVLDNK